MRSLYHSACTRPAGALLRACAAVLVACALALAGVGCSVRRPGTTAPPPRMSRGASGEAVLHEQISVKRTESEVSYRGEGWALTVSDRSGWRQAADGEGATLELDREAAGTRLNLVLRAYPIRRQMPVETFLTAHTMWMAEEGGPRVEYEQDEQSGQWQGYSIHADQEAYYAFFVSDDRAYVIEESAAGGVLSKAEVEEFRRIVSAFRCHPRTGSDAALPPEGNGPAEDS